MNYISNDTQVRFGHKQLAAVLVTAIVVILIVSLSFSGLFAAIPNQSPESTPTPTPTTTITPLSPTPTATPVPTQTATPNPTRMPVPIDFTCGAFSVTVGVDLNDGMDNAEAIAVATAIFDHELPNAAHEVKSAQATSNEVWQVGFNWELSSSATLPNGTAVELKLGHVFDVTIYAQNRTVTYTRCM